MADAGTGQRLPSDEAPSEERLLLDHVHRIEAAPKGYYAVHIHLSQLGIQYRQPHFIRIAGRSFDALTNAHDVTHYVLGSSDMVLICREVSVNEIDPPILKLRSLFSEDPLTSGVEGSLDDRFTTWYDLSQAGDRSSFLSVAEELEAEAQARLRRRLETGEGPGRTMLGEPLAPGNLSTVTNRLQSVRIADLVRQQSAVEVYPGARGDVLFQEHYVSMIDLQKRIAPDVNLFANPWLFQYLTEVLDRRLLSVVAQSDFAAMKDAMSLNLNIATVLSPGFQTFHEKAREAAGRVVIEMQAIDIFSDITAYISARDWLHGHDYRVLVDGLSPLALQFFDPTPLEADFVKVTWSQEFLDGIPEDRMEDMRHMVKNLGTDTLILGRAESEDAVKWALTLGIHRFQGHFVDQLVDAMVAKGII